MHIEEIDYSGFVNPGDSQLYGLHANEIAIDHSGVRNVIIERFGYDFFVPEYSISGDFQRQGKVLKDELLACEDWLFLERMLEPCDKAFPFGLNGGIEPGETLFSSDIEGLCKIDYSSDWIEMVNDPEIPFPFGRVQIDLSIPRRLDCEATVLSLSLGVMAPFVALYYPQVHPDEAVHKLIQDLSSCKSAISALLALDAYFYGPCSQPEAGFDPLFKASLSGYKGDALSFIVRNRLLSEFVTERELMVTLEECETPDGMAEFIKSMRRRGVVSATAAIKMEMDI